MGIYSFRELTYPTEDSTKKSTPSHIITILYILRNKTKKTLKAARRKQLILDNESSIRLASLSSETTKDRR